MNRIRITALTIIGCLALAAPALANTIYWGNGNDYAVDNDSGSNYYMGGGHDVCFMKGGPDFCDGGDGNDRVEGGQGGDNLQGGQGEDKIIASGDGGDRDYFSGGGGPNDWCYRGQNDVNLGGCEVVL